MFNKNNGTFGMSFVDVAVEKKGQSTTTTSAMNIPGAGCLVRVSTIGKNIHSESLTFVPSVNVFPGEIMDGEGEKTTQKPPFLRKI